MKQTRKASATEALINIVIGFSIQFAAMLFIARSLGYALTLVDNAYIGVFMTAVSFARSYMLRRLFEVLRVREILP